MEVTIFDEIDTAIGTLNSYLIDAPDIEKSNINALKNHIEEANKSTIKALEVYPNLFLSIKTWYEQTNCTDVNINKALTLLEKTNNVLISLNTFCKSLTWPLSLSVPATLFSEIDELLEISESKKSSLNLHLKNQKDIIPPKKNSAIDELKHLLNNGIHRLKKKRLVLAEKKTEHIQFINQIRKLHNCFKPESPNCMKKFWNSYSNLESFKELMNVLMLNDTEKKSWLCSFEYLKIANTEKANMLNSLFNFSAYHMQGSAITPDILLKKLYEIIKPIYDQVIEQEHQHDDQTLWLEQIEVTIEGIIINPLLHELIISEQLLSQSIKKPQLNIAKHIQTLLTLKNTIKKTSQSNIHSVHQLRQLLSQLISQFDDLNNQLKTAYEENQLIVSHLNSLQALSQSNDFKLTQIDDLLLIERIRKVINEINDQFGAYLTGKMSFKSGDICTHKFIATQAFINQQKQEATQLLSDFNDKGTIERKESLAQLKKFIAKQQGIWEMILRFFSSNYRLCMTKIESILRNKDSDFNKVEEITLEFKKAKKNSSYIINQRINFFSKSNTNGIFLDENERDESGIELHTTMPDRVSA